MDGPFLLRWKNPPDFSSEELLEFLEINDVVDLERECDGSLLIMSPLTLKTAREETEILFQLATWARQDGTGEAFHSRGSYYLPNLAMREPDVSWIRRDRSKHYPSKSCTPSRTLCRTSSLRSARSPIRCAACKKKCRSTLTMACGSVGSLTRTRARPTCTTRHRGPGARAADIAGWLARIAGLRSRPDPSLALSLISISPSSHPAKCGRTIVSKARPSRTLPGVESVPQRCAARAHHAIAALRHERISSRPRSRRVQPRHLS